MDSIHKREGCNLRPSLYVLSPREIFFSRYRTYYLEIKVYTWLYEGKER